MKKKINLACFSIVLNLLVPISCSAGPEIFKIENPKVDNSQFSTGAGLKPSGSHTLKGSLRDDELAECGIAVTEKANSSGALQHIVNEVLRGSKAEAWGILPGDIILSVQNESSSFEVTIQRDGKIYSADLSRDRQIQTVFSKPVAPISPVFNESRIDTVPRKRAPQEEMVGHYVGQLSNGGGAISTDINMAPAGNLYGTYRQVLADGPYTGKLEKSGMQSQTRVSFLWSDIYGTGTCTLSFSPDYSSFDGIWTRDGGGNFIRQWNGVKTP